MNEIKPHMQEAAIACRRLVEDSYIDLYTTLKMPKLVAARFMFAAASAALFELIGPEEFKRSVDEFIDVTKERYKQ